MADNKAKVKFNVERNADDKVLLNDETKVKPINLDEEGNNDSSDDPPVDTPIVDDTKEEEDKVDPSKVDDPPADPPVEEFSTEGLTEVSITNEEGSDVDLFIDKDGNAIDNKGEVVYTKDQLEESSDSDDKQEESDSKVKLELTKVIEDIGISPVDESNNPKNYTNDSDGVKKYIKDVYAQGALDNATDNNANTFLSELYEQYPVMRDVHNHLEKNGGSIDGFNFTVDINKDISKDNVAQQKAIITKDRLDRGDTTKEIDDYVKYLEDSDKLFEVSKQSKDRVKDRVKQVEAQQARQQEIDANTLWGIDQQGKALNIEGSVYDKVFNKKEIKVGDTTYPIPEIIKISKGDGSFANAKRTEFFKFLYDIKPRKVGNQVVYASDYDIKLQEKQAASTLDNTLYDALMLFTNNEVDQLVKSKVEKDKFEEVKKKFKVKQSESNIENTDAKVKLKVKRKLN